MALSVGDRVRYRGYRGDTGSGTVLMTRGKDFKVKRDFSADDGVWFTPGFQGETLEAEGAATKPAPCQGGGG